MAWDEILGVYDVKSEEVAGFCEHLYDLMMNTAKEQSGGMTVGLNEHAIARQRSYVESAKALAKAIFDQPIPDMPRFHPIPIECDFSQKAPFIRDKNNKVLNQTVQSLTRKWGTCWFELVGSQSAGLAGGMHTKDYERLIVNLDSIDQFVTVIESQPELDLPETSDPEAQLVEEAPSTRVPYSRKK